jgi:hypothetical protein
MVYSNKSAIRRKQTKPNQTQFQSQSMPVLLALRSLGEGGSIVEWANLRKAKMNLKSNRFLKNPVAPGQDGRATGA